MQELSIQLAEEKLGFKHLSLRGLQDFLTEKTRTEDNPRGWEIERLKQSVFIPHLERSYTRITGNMGTGDDTTNFLAVLFQRLGHDAGRIVAESSKRGERAYERLTLLLSKELVTSSGVVYRTGKSTIILASNYDGSKPNFRRKDHYNIFGKKGNNVPIEVFFR